LEQVGVQSSLSDGSQLWVDPENMVLEISMAEGEIYLIPSIDDYGDIVWECQAGEGIKPAQLPDYCQ
jgi:hypothetical protein